LNGDAQEALEAAARLVQLEARELG
jgi:hypothetical protein